MDVFDWKYPGNSLLTFVGSGCSNNSDDDCDNDKNKNIRFLKLSKTMVLGLIPAGNTMFCAFLPPYPDVSARTPITVDPWIIL
jgi:hypothetical protein